ncbi:hypothetical protein QW180_30745 [Vibrio sinaloensis]|nr:hypothetical protein [Vibrio sinaloensis]
MVEQAREIVSVLDGKWTNDKVRDVLEYCSDVELIDFSDRVLDELIREPRQEVYDRTEFGQEKKEIGCATVFLEMQTRELEKNIVILFVTIRITVRSTG